MFCDLFSPFGNIKSLSLQESELGKYGFVCYNVEKGFDKEYGLECAEKSIKKLHNL